MHDTPLLQAVPCGNSIVLQNVHYLAVIRRVVDVIISLVPVERFELFVVRVVRKQVLQLVFESVDHPVDQVLPVFEKVTIPVHVVRFGVRLAVCRRRE